MSLQENIKLAIKQLNENEAGHKVSALRKLRCEIQHILAVSGSNSISDEKIIDLLKFRIKSKMNMVQLYLHAARPDLAGIETAEVGILQNLLPPSVSDSEIIFSVNEFIKGDAASQSFNRIMGKLMQLYKGKNIDGLRASILVKEILSRSE